MYKIFKFILFLLDAEKAHKLTTSFIRWPFISHFIKYSFDYHDLSLEREIFGLKFKNPVGLAAGFDKDGKYFRAMSKLGFGYIEIGTVTPKPQKGNPLPRLFRLPKDQALINRMGFNNEGVEALVERLKRFEKGDLIIGGNIGKNKTTPNESAVDDYVFCFNKLFEYVDYFVVNVSSPNTPGLRELQDKKPLLKILNTLQQLNLDKPKPKPILLKIAPDLNHDQLDDIIEIVNESNISGLVATNTTISRSNLKTAEEEISTIGNGGLSGRPVQSMSTAVIKYIHDKSNGSIPIIGVGGIHSGETANEKIEAGAQLIQVYSGLVYEGPSLVKKIKKYLSAH